MTEGNPDNPKDRTGYIIGMNIGLLAVYTIISKFINDGFVIDAFFIACHFFSCLILALTTKKWVWVLTAFIILLIGCSTCANFLDMQL